MCVADDGGFYDYNDAWVTFNGSTGLKIAGASGAASTGVLNISNLGTGLVKATGGTLGLATAADLPIGSGNYIQNTTSQQASSNYNISGNGVIAGTLMVGANAVATDRLEVRDAMSVNEIKFRNVGGGDDSDPYRLRKVQSSSNTNYLELQLNDDATEEFRILGNSCVGSPACSEYAGVLAHGFVANGNAYHVGSLGIGVTSPSTKLHVNGAIWAGNTVDGWGFKNGPLIGNYTDVGPGVAGTFPLYLAGSAQGLFVTNTSDAAFFGLLTRGAGYNDYNTVIGWGDDGGDNLEFRFNNAVVASITSDGLMTQKTGISHSNYTHSNLLLEQTNGSLNACVALHNTNYSDGGVLFGRSGGGGINVGSFAWGGYWPVYASGFSVTSDITMKKDVEYLKEADFNTCLDQIRNIQSIRFRYNSESAVKEEGKDYRPNLHLGVSAQSLPKEVQSEIDADPSKAGGEKKLGVSLADMNGLLLAGVKALDNQQQSEKTELNELRAKVDAQSKVIEELKKQVEEIKASSVKTGR